MATGITFTTNGMATKYTLSTGARGPAGPAGADGADGSDANVTQTAIQNAITDNAAFLTDIGAVATTSLSTTGGANKVPLLDANANWTTGAFANNDSIMSDGGNIYIPDKRGIEFLRRDGTKSGALIHGWDEHGGSPGTPEMILKSPERIALIAYKGMQVGPNDPGRYPRYTQLVSGNASGNYPATEYMPSNVLFFQTNVWDGAVSQTDHIGFQAHALDTSGTNSEVRIYNNAWLTESGGVDTAGRGDATGDVIGRIHASGIWHPGAAPEFDTLTPDGATITQTCSIYKAIQAASVTLEGNRTLAISGAAPGMRGVIYITQDSVGSRTLTPTSGSALDLSTTANYVDRLTWEFDGVYYSYATQKNVQRVVVISDSDAQAFITAAGLTVNTQKIAVDNLVASLKSASLWTKFHAIYPFVGATETAHSKDLKGAYNGTFAGTVDHTSHASGTIVSTGMNGYFNTGFKPSNGAQNDIMAYVYSRTASPTTAKVFVGATGTNYYRIKTNGANVNTDGPNTGSLNTASVGGFSGDFRKHFGLIRSSSTACNMRVSTTAGAFTTGASGTPDTRNFYILADNYAGTAGSHSDFNCGFAAFSTAMTAGEWTTFTGIIDTFQTALSRANP